MGWVPEGKRVQPGWFLKSLIAGGGVMVWGSRGGYYIHGARREGAEQGQERGREPCVNMSEKIGEERPKGLEHLLRLGDTAWRGRMPSLGAGGGGGAGRGALQAWRRGKMRGRDMMRMWRSEGFVFRIDQMMQRV
eukprot:757652-Hanusia_phi.AAC.3